MLEKWSGPYGGVPPFDKVKVPEFLPTVEMAMSEGLADIAKIAANPEAPTFENTAMALERAGELMNRVMPLYYTWSHSMSTPEFQTIEKDLAVKLSSYSDAIYQNSQLFKRFETLHKSSSALTPEQQRLIWLRYTKFILRGARLEGAAKARVAEINQRLAFLMTQFGQNILSDEEKEALVIEDAAGLRGLPQTFINAAAEEGRRRGLQGKWVISNTRSSMEPFLTYAQDRSLREKAFRIWMMRGDKDGATHNNPLAVEILKLRSESARLLGYPTFAHWKLADTMAKEPKAAMDLMLKVWAPATTQARREVAEMQAVADAENVGIKIEPWDYRFYLDKVRKAKYDFNFDLVKPYLQLEKVRDAMFWMAEKLYGFKFSPVSGIPVFHKDMTVYEVKRSDGGVVGLFYFDPFARPGKSSGAWMTSYREQQGMDDSNILPLVSNNSNFIPGGPGEPVFLGWDECITMFHEFGHALHGLASKVTYPSISGTNTAGDFVELPSQVHENFLETEEILRFFTDPQGRSLPKELIEKMANAKYFGEGFATVEFLSSAIVDMKLHLAETPPTDMRRFEQETLREIGMPSEIIMRHRIPHFSHIFCGENYAAGYYGYLWAQVLDQDAFEAFVETGDAFDEKVAQRFFKEVLSVGDSIDPAEAYRRFRGRDAQVDALLRGRGFVN